MDLRDKIVKVFTASFPVDYVRLEEDDGITGFVVSPRFDGMSMLDRQTLIDQTLRSASPSLSPAEQRHVLMIAALTPAEYDTVGARIRVLKVRERAGGGVDVVLHGGLSDAEYVRGVFNTEKGVSTTDPARVSGAVGTLMSFRANGARSRPLTRAKALRLLKRDRYVQVMEEA